MHRYLAFIAISRLHMKIMNYFVAYDWENAKRHRYCQFGCAG